MTAISLSSNAAHHSFQNTVSPQLRRTADQAQAAANALQMQARDAWQKVASAESNAHAIDSQANQAVSSAHKAKKDLNSFGAAVLSASKTEGASASRPVPSGTYTASANASATAPITTPAMLNNIGQPIGARFSVKA